MELPIKFLFEGEDVLSMKEALGGDAFGRIQGKRLESHGACREVPGHPLIFV